MKNFRTADDGASVAESLSEPASHASILALSGSFSSLRSACSSFRRCLAASCASRSSSSRCLRQRCDGCKGGPVRSSSMSSN